MNSCREPCPDAAGFAATYRLQSAFVARTLRSFGVPRGDVDDAMQEVFLVLHRRWSELRPDARLQSWLYGVARRVSRNQRRARSRQRTDLIDRVGAGHVPEPADVQAPLPDQSLLAKQGLESLRAALHGLPEALRSVYLLTEFEEWTAAEIATLCGRPRNTVSSQLRIARRHVRCRLARTRLLG